jgi:hypothetical protein
MSVKGFRDVTFRESQSGKSFGVVSWKGSDICIDIDCECGVVSHYDGYFAAVIECPACKRQYWLNPRIELKEIEGARDRSVKQAWISEE